MGIFSLFFCLCIAAAISDPSSYEDNSIDFHIPVQDASKHVKVVQFHQNLVATATPGETRRHVIEITLAPGVHLSKDTIREWIESGRYKDFVHASKTENNVVTLHARYPRPRKWVKPYLKAKPKRYIVILPASPCVANPAAESCRFQQVDHTARPHRSRSPKKRRRFPKKKPRRKYRQRVRLLKHVAQVGKNYGTLETSIVDGRCVLSGVVHLQNTTNNVAVLPRNCRPRYFQIEAGLGDKASLRVNIYRGGLVRLANTTSSWVSLTGIVIPPSNTPQTELTLANGWKQLSKKPVTVTSLNGTCSLSGLVRISPLSRNGTVNGTIITHMPPECIPTTKLMLAALSGTEVHQIDVNPNGELEWKNGNVVVRWISLDGLIFVPKPENASSIPLLTGFRALPGYRAPTAVVHSNSCFLSGGVKGDLSQANSIIGRLPEDCRPKKRLVFVQGAADVRVDVFPNGFIRFISMREVTNFITLDSISFERYIGPPLFTASSSSAALFRKVTVPPEFNEPSFTEMHDLCMGAGFFQLPKHFAPEDRLDDFMRPMQTNIPISWGNILNRCVPEGRLVYDRVQKDGKPLRIDITSDILTLAVPNRTVQLDGMLFPTTAARKTPIPLTAGAWISEKVGVPSYVLTGLRTCLLSGLAKVHGANMANFADVIVTLPAECRPAKRAIFHVQSGAGSQRIDVFPNGQIKWMTIENKCDWVSFDGIVFPTTFALPTITKPLTLRNGYYSFGGDYQTPSSVRDGDLCMLSGLIRGRAKQYHRILGTIEEYCRPAKWLSFAVRHGDTLLQLEVRSNGDVAWVDGKSIPAYIPLDGIVYVPYSTVTNATKALIDKADNMKKEEDALIAKHLAQLLQERTAQKQVLNLDMWGAYGGGFLPPTEYKVDKFCFWSGVGADGTFTKPFGTGACRPRKTAVFNQLPPAHEKVLTVVATSVSPQGLVRPLQTPTKGEFSFNGMIFAQDTAPRHYMLLRNPFQPFNSSQYHRPYFVRQGSFCLVGGAVFDNSTVMNEALDVIGHLPSWCRPRKGELAFDVSNGNDPHRIHITAKGEVVWQSRGPTDRQVFLDGIIFPVTKQGGKAIEFATRWRPHSGDRYRKAFYKVAGNLCALSGVAEGTATKLNRVIGKLDPTCRPAQKLWFHVAEVVGDNDDTMIHQIEVAPNGIIKYIRGRAEHRALSLDGIIFLNVPPDSIPKKPDGVNQVIGNLGGEMDSRNLAKTARAFSSSYLNNKYSVFRLNDGKYGSNNAWTPSPGRPVGGVHFAGLQWLEPVTIQSIAFARDNVNNVSDSFTGTYLLQVTLNDDPDTAQWREIGQIDLKKSSTCFRKVFNLVNPVEVRAIRLVFGTASIIIDELEAYTRPFPEVHVVREKNGFMRQDNIMRETSVNVFRVDHPEDVSVIYLNDARYGDDYAWHPSSAPATAQIEFNDIVRIRHLAFSRDNRDRFTDKTGNRFQLQIQTPTQQDWRTVAAWFMQDLPFPEQRHVWEFSRVLFATKMRIVSFDPVVIDELELYSV